MAANNNHSNNINIKNRRATFDYEIIETFTAGIVLTGTEIKSIRQGKCGLTDTYCMVINGELWVKNMYIAEYSYGSYNNHTTHRDRKLLLNRTPAPLYQRARSGQARHCHCPRQAPV